MSLTQVVVKCALPGEALVAVLAIALLVLPLVPLVHRADVLREVRHAPEHLATVAHGALVLLLQHHPHHADVVLLLLVCPQVCRIRADPPARLALVGREVLGGVLLPGGALGVRRCGGAAALEEGRWSRAGGPALLGGAGGGGR